MTGKPQEIEKRERDRERKRVGSHGKIRPTEGVKTWKNLREEESWILEKLERRLKRQKNAKKVNERACLDLRK